MGPNSADMVRTIPLPTGRAFFVICGLDWEAGKGEKIFELCEGGERSLRLCCRRSSSEVVSMRRDSEGTDLIVPFGVFEGVGWSCEDVVEVVCNAFIALSETGDSVLACALIESVLASTRVARSIFLLSAKAICQPCFLARMVMEEEEGKGCVFRKIMAVLHNPQQPRSCLTEAAECCFSPGRSLCISISGSTVESGGGAGSRAGIAHLFVLDTQRGSRTIGAAAVGVPFCKHVKDKLTPLPVRRCFNLCWNKVAKVQITSKQGL